MLGQITHGDPTTHYKLLHDLVVFRESSTAILETARFIYLFISVPRGSTPTSLFNSTSLPNTLLLAFFFSFCSFKFSFLSEKDYSQLVFMSTTAGSLWNLQAIQSMCQIEQDKVSNVTKNIYTYYLFSDCRHLAERKAEKNNISYRAGFSLENSRAFYLPSNIRMISPISEVQLPLNKNTESLGKKPCPEVKDIHQKLLRMLSSRT